MMNLWRLASAIATVWGYMPADKERMGITGPLWQEVVVEFRWSTEGLELTRITRDEAYLPTVLP